ncbi:diaminopimelate epimerase [Methylovorus sp. MM2]|uniref:diaminopimelate epimerase n=1 Tax=Methylovorus sp. MM2 TaxID=1848038 RepID=UPI0007DF310E|nr:diaminopimelate epimerase [Methylovorus sp. MM2]OAM51812.1 diaminopimelate epimerase [Methylovorus sp. MM2]
MKIKFTKMHGIGNDFVVIDAYSQPVKIDGAKIKSIADRHFGIGFDQLLLVERSQLPNVDFRYRIFNADGGEVEQCGNGARCFVRFVHDKGLTQKDDIQVETAGGLISLKLEDNGQVTVNMGAPHFALQDIPFTAEKLALTYTLDVNGFATTISALSMGNPHAIQIVQDTEAAPVEIHGPIIESHPRFPQRVNAGFMQINDTHHIKLRVYERGSGETLACGTGACAAVVSGIRLGHLQSPVKVSMHGGDLSIRWDGDGTPVWMTGPAETVFEGELELSDTEA